MDPTFVHIIDGRNFGDLICSPRGHFAEWADCRELDYRALPVSDGHSPLVIGGGGMLHPGVDEWILRESRQRPCIVWGIGLNYHAPAPPDDWPRFLAHCRLAGIRDRGEAERLGLPWAPCPTCLSPELDWHQGREPRYPVVAYSHFERPIPGTAPAMDNRADGRKLDVVLRFLASSEAVLTNSYHGALWALWLGRRVALWQPFSTRFSTGLPPLPCAESIQHARECAVCYPEFLQECRSATGRFVIQVWQTLGSL